MTTAHLTESEFVDLLEDALDARRAAHLETCASCRDQAGALRAMLRDTAAVPGPEPSPLFWDHFQARVHDAVGAETAGGRSVFAWTGFRGLVPWAAAAALIIAVVSGALLLDTVRTGGPKAPLVVEAPASDGRPAATPDAANAEVWDVLTTAASGVAFDEAHAAGMHVQPAAIEHAVQDLSAAERTELGRLLQSELKRSSN
jgi:hypothetical protein